MVADLVILRDGQRRGAVAPNGILSTNDSALQSLWARWQRDGFRTMVPIGTTATNGVMADGVAVVRPGPETLGLVAYQLEISGYEVSLAAPSAPATVQAEAQDPYAQDDED